MTRGRRGGGGVTYAEARGDEHAEGGAHGGRGPRGERGGRGTEGERGGRGGGGEGGSTRPPPRYWRICARAWRCRVRGGLAAEVTVTAAGAL
eukprot:557411-Rhodomonas_salina.1